MTIDPVMRKINSDLADQINAEARANPRSPYAGKFVGIANGHVAVTADTLDDAIGLLLRFEPDRERVFCFQAGVDYSEVQYIWETC